MKENYFKDITFILSFISLLGFYFYFYHPDAFSTGTSNAFDENFGLHRKLSSIIFMIFLYHIDSRTHVKEIDLKTKMVLVNLVNVMSCIILSSAMCLVNCPTLSDTANVLPSVVCPCPTLAHA